MIALIPARGGSKRIPRKNVKILAGHPLLAYTIAAAQQSGVFESIIVCTDHNPACVIAQDMGVPFLSRQSSDDAECDIAWVSKAIEARPAQSFALLRPTSPFRTADTIRRAHEQFKRSEVHSIRAVQPVTEHPGKMWTWIGAGYPMRPYTEHVHADGTPWHSSPTQSLPRVYIQNSSLEMAWSYVVPAFGTISGKKVAPFFTEGMEGFALDYPDDWDTAERYAASHPEALPRVDVAALSVTPAAQ